MIGILGGGLAGLTTARQLAIAGSEPVVVLEKESFIGGASRTVREGPYRFDLGGHRFYTRKQRVQAFFEEVIAENLIHVERLSHICLNGKMVDYPLTPLNALKSLGPVTSARVLLQYLKAKTFPAEGIDGTFEHWVVQRFGRGLYDIYFKGYTEKVWGIPCDRLSSDFAEQRIKGLSFREVVKQALIRTKDAPSSLIGSFVYPRLGFGELPDRLAAALEPPHQIMLDSKIDAVHHDGRHISAMTVRSGQACTAIDVSRLVSTVPLLDLVESLRPEASADVIAAARQLRYRDLIVIFLAFDREQVTGDSWTYFPDGDICFGRMHEPRNWSRPLAPPGKTSLVVEWFATKGDDVWNSPDDALRDAVVADLAKLQLIRPEEVDACRVVRLEKAYPLYRLGYSEHRQTVLGYLAQFENLYCSGRSGAFIYTSSDHYIDMGMKIADNIMGDSHNLSGIGLEAGYAEA